jgi:hypothetical protein
LVRIYILENMSSGPPLKRLKSKAAKSSSDLGGPTVQTERPKPSIANFFTRPSVIIIDIIRLFVEIDYNGRTGALILW